MKFIDSVQCRQAIQRYAMCKGYNVRILKSEMKKLFVRYELGCTWRLYGSLMQDEHTFLIKTLVKEHKCFRSLRNRQAISEWIAKEYLEKS